MARHCTGDAIKMGEALHTGRHKTFQVFLPPPATKTTAKYDHAKTSGTRPVGLHDLRLGFGFSLGFGHTVMAGGCNMHCAVIVVLCASMRVAIGLV